MTTDDSTDPALLPVPWHVNLYAALLKNPGRAAVVLGIPFAAVAYAASVAGLLPPTPGVIPHAGDAMMGWVAGSLLVYIQLVKPY